MDWAVFPQMYDILQKHCLGFATEWVSEKVVPVRSHPDGRLLQMTTETCCLTRKDDFSCSNNHFRSSFLLNTSFNFTSMVIKNVRISWYHDAAVLHYYSLFSEQDHDTNMNTKIDKKVTTENTLPTVYHDMWPV